MPRKVRVAIQVLELSHSERRLCEAIANGSTFKEAAHEMGISPSTVYTIGERAMRKLGVDRAEAIIGLWPHVLAFERWQRISVVANSTND